MRKFYLSKNSCGYYRVHFIDPVTGKQGIGKSTHTKDWNDAVIMACSWLKNGVPEARSNSRAFENSRSSTVPANLKSFVDNLSENDALKVIELICSKFDFIISEI